MKRRSSQTGAPLFTACPLIEDPEALLADLRRLVDSHRLSNHGPRVCELERRLKRMWGVRAQTVANATLGLELAFTALGLRGKAIVPSFTFFSTAHACVRAGLEPVFADIDPRTYCLAPAAVEALIDEDTALVVPVHTYGNLADFAYFESLRERGIAVVYDAAHAMGVRSRFGEPAGFGDASVFSFHATKIVAAGEGGAVATADPALGQAIRRLANFGLINETEVFEIGTNAKLSEVHALFALHGLKSLETSIDRRLAVMDRYNESFGDEAKLTLPRPQPGVGPNGQFYPVRFRSRKLREKAFDDLVRKHIYPRRYFAPALHQLAAYRHSAHGPLPVTEAVADTVLCLPLHSAMSLSNADFVADALLHSLRPRARRVPRESLSPRVILT